MSGYTDGRVALCAHWASLPSCLEPLLLQPATPSAIRLPFSVEADHVYKGLSASLQTRKYSSKNHWTEEANDLQHEHD